MKLRHIEIYGVDVIARTDAQLFTNYIRSGREPVSFSEVKIFQEICVILITNFSTVYRHMMSHRVW